MTDNFGKADMAQILVGSFVMGEVTFYTKTTDISLTTGILTFALLAVIALIIFYLISGSRMKYFWKRVLYTLPVAFIIATLLHLIIVGSFNSAHILAVTALSLPISAGFDALVK